MPLWPASTGHNPGTVALRKLVTPLTGIRHDGLAEPSKKKSSASEAGLRGLRQCAAYLTHSIYGC